MVLFLVFGSGRLEVLSSLSGLAIGYRIYLFLDVFFSSGELAVSV